MDRPDSSPPADCPNTRFVQLLGEHERQLNAYVLALVPNWADADDIVQQTRIRLWEQFGSYDPAKDFGAWARTIALFQIKTYRKRASRTSKRFTDSAIEKLISTASSLAKPAGSRQVFLAECVETMQAADRNFLYRCYSGAETIKAVALDLGRSFNATRQRLFRLRVRLFECVEGKLAKEEAR